MNRPSLLLAALAVAGCSSLGESGSAVAIEVITPSPAVVEVGDTITLHARVLDQQGDSLAGATIRWRTVSVNISLDSVTGRLSGDSGTTAQVQAVSGSLVSSPVTFTVRPRSDTVIVAVDSILVPVTDTASAALAPKVADSLGTGLQSRRVAITIVAPSPAGARLTGDVVSDTVTTGVDGLPFPAIWVRRAGVTSGDSVIVQVQVKRPSGAIVPGSGQVIRVFFQ